LAKKTIINPHIEETTTEEDKDTETSMSQREKKQLKIPTNLSLLTSWTYDS
jgi:hypothetical protein